MSPAGEIGERVLSRVKAMAELDISERRMPQDGRFKIATRKRAVDCHVSIMASIFGEDAWYMHSTSGR